MSQRTLWGQGSTYEILTTNLQDPNHLFITGPAGSGKSTLINDFLTMYYTAHPEQKRVHDSILWLSSEKDRGIHTIREKVTDFCKRSPSSPGQIRWIIFDDADSLPLISQQALRRPMETYSYLTKFIFAARQTSVLISPLRSRCLSIELEPISIYDTIQQLYTMFSITFDSEKDKETLSTWFYTHSPAIHKAMPLLKIVRACQLDKQPLSQILDTLNRFVFTSEPLAIDFIKSIVKHDIHSSIEIISTFFFDGFLLDDILLALERSLLFYPMLSAEKRYLVLKFIMRGWISIQQGKEYWLDTLDILFDQK